MPRKLCYNEGMEKEREKAARNEWCEGGKKRYVLSATLFTAQQNVLCHKLAISPYTVGKHVQNILHKLGVTNRTQAVSYTLFEGGDLQK